mgnify:CR=1 FL=1|jgi:Tfp pilus assembly protein PilE
MSKKKGFTLIETLMSAGMLSLIVTIGLSILALITWTLYTGQMEGTARSNLNETVYYLTRELQSAESIKISQNGKVLQIKERGRSEYNLQYTIVENYPVDYFAFKGKRLLDVKAEESIFLMESGSVTIKLSVVKNNLDINQTNKKIELTVSPRCEVFEEAD